MLGAFTGKVNNKRSGKFATFPTQGRQLTLDVFVRGDRRNLRFHIHRVVHGFRSLERGSGSCNVNVACQVANEYVRGLCNELYELI